MHTCEIVLYATTSYMFRQVK